MNKLLLFVLAFSAQFIATAQKIKFTDSTNIWLEAGMDTADPSFLYDKFYYKGDTIINGRQYLRLFDYRCTQHIPTQTNPHPARLCSTVTAGFIWEDTTGIVYRAYYAGSVLKEDTLYNYNLQLNDTFGSKRKVIKVDSVMIGSVYHKIWEFQYIETPPLMGQTYKVVEGIGCLNDMFQPLSGPDFEAGRDLFCFRNHMANPALNKPIGNFDNINSCTLGIKENTLAKAGKLAIIPHPANTNGYIQFPYSITGTISIYNNTGQLIVNEKICNTERWLLQNQLQAAGMYFYRVSAGDQIFTGKFIYE